MLTAPPVAAVEAEQALVGSMLVAAEPLQLLEILDAEADLTQPVLQKVVAAIRRLVAAETPVDFVTVLGELRRTGETVTAAGQTDVGLLLFQYADAAPVPASARWYLRAVLNYGGQCHEDTYRCPKAVFPHLTLRRGA